MRIDRQKDGAVEETEERGESTIGVVGEPPADSEQHDPGQPECGPAESYLQRARVVRVQKKAPARFVHADGDARGARRDQRAGQLSAPLQLGQWGRIVRSITE